MAEFFVLIYCVFNKQTVYRKESILQAILATEDYEEEDRHNWKFCSTCKKFLPKLCGDSSKLLPKPDILYKLQLTFSNIVLQGILQKEKRVMLPLRRKNCMEDFQYNLQFASLIKNAL